MSTMADRHQQAHQEAHVLRTKQPQLLLDVSGRMQPCWAVCGTTTAEARLARAFTTTQLVVSATATVRSSMRCASQQRARKLTPPHLQRVALGRTPPCWNVFVAAPAHHARVSETTRPHVWVTATTRLANLCVRHQAQAPAKVPEAAAAAAAAVAIAAVTVAVARG